MEISFKVRDGSTSGPSPASGFCMATSSKDTWEKRVREETINDGGTIDLTIQIMISLLQCSLTKVRQMNITSGSDCQKQGANLQGILSSPSLRTQLVILSPTQLPQMREPLLMTAIAKRSCKQKWRLMRDSHSL